MNKLESVIQLTNDAMHKRRPNENIIQWAERNIVLTSAHGDAGPLRLRNSRHLWEPLLAFEDREVTQETFLKATQIGGTMVAEIALLWSMVNRPGSFQWFCQSDSKAEEEMVDRIKPMMLRCNSLRPLLPSDERKISSSGINNDKSGFVFAITGHSSNDVNSSTRHLVIVDELGHYDQENHFYTIKGRTGYTAGKGNSKILIVSQAGKNTDGEMHKCYSEGTMEEWMVPCEACGNYIVPHINQLDAGGLSFSDETLKLKDNKGRWILGKVEQVLTLTCPYCKHGHKDTPKLKQFWNDNGKYQSTNPNPMKGHRSFHCSAYISYSWIELIKEWFVACEFRKKYGDNEKWTLFFQRRQASCLNPSEYYSQEVRTDKPYDPVTKWEDEYSRWMAVDVQDDKFYAVVRAYSIDGRGRLLYSNWLNTIEQVLEIQEKYNIPYVTDRFGKRTYRVIWDTGNAKRLAEVYGYCVKYNHLAVKGDSSGTKQFEEKVVINGKIYLQETVWCISPTRGDPYRGTVKAGTGPTCPLVLFATDTLKELLVKLRDGKCQEWLCLPREENPGYEDYNTGMFNEEFTTTDPKGRPIKNGRWQKVNEKLTNEAFDCETYILGAAVMAGVKFDHLLLKTGEEFISPEKQ